MNSVTSKAKVDVSKSEAVAVCDEVINFCSKAQLAFSDLVSRMRIYREAVLHSADPVPESLVIEMGKAADDWERLCREMLQ